MRSDFFQEGYTGDVDPVTGFAVVASLETCFVWKYSQVCRNLVIYRLETHEPLHEGIDRDADLLHLRMPS